MHCGVDFVVFDFFNIYVFHRTFGLRHGKYDWAQTHNGNSEWYLLCKWMNLIKFIQCFHIANDAYSGFFIYRFMRTILNFIKQHDFGLNSCIWELTQLMFCILFFVCRQWVAVSSKNRTWIGVSDFIPVGAKLIFSRCKKCDSKVWHLKVKNKCSICMYFASSNKIIRCSNCTKLGPWNENTKNVHYCIICPQTFAYEND